MKRIVFSGLVLLLITTSCQQNVYKGDVQTPYMNAVVKEAAQTLTKFKKTSPLLLDNERLALWDKIQTYSDNLVNTTFKEYLESTEEVAVRMEDTIPILYFYREAFDKILYELKNTKVKNGSTSVWLLYNMGFVIKTPSGCFGIDLDHRLAEQLEPFLDFICITHNHGDHYNMKLLEAMVRNGKPVISNFYKDSREYLSTKPTSYKIKNFTIDTDMSDHLANPDMQDFVTLFRVECGDDSGNFSILHCGDSGFNPEQFKHVQGPVSMVALRWGAPRESNIFGIGEGQVTTNYAVLSHLIELRHKPYPHGQASITKTLEHLPNVKCENTIMPFWGEKLIWSKGKMH